jgi:hypothetical protein
MESGTFPSSAIRTECAMILVEAGDRAYSSNETRRRRWKLCRVRRGRYVVKDSKLDPTPGRALDIALDSRFYL